MQETSEQRNSSALKKLVLSTLVALCYGSGIAFAAAALSLSGPTFSSPKTLASGFSLHAFRLPQMEKKVLSAAFNLPALAHKTATLSHAAVASLPTDLASGITISDTLPELAYISPVENFTLPHPAILKPEMITLAIPGTENREIGVAGVSLLPEGFTPSAYVPHVFTKTAFAPETLSFFIPKIGDIKTPKVEVAFLPKTSREGMVLGVSTTAQELASATKKKTLPFLDRISLSLFCTIAGASNGLDTSRCNYDAIASGQIAFAPSAPVAPLATLTPTAPSAPVAPQVISSPVSGSSPSPVYITNYVTKYVPVPGPAGRDGKDGKNGSDGVTTINNIQAPSAIGSYIIPSYSSPSTAIGISTISYLKDTTIENPGISGGTALNLVLTTPTLKDASFSGLSVFNGAATFNGSTIFGGSVTANTITATSSVITNATSTNAYIANLSAASSTLTDAVIENATSTNIFSANGTFLTASTTNLFAQNLSVGTTSANSIVLSNDLTVGGTTTLATTTVTDFTASTASTTNLVATNATSTNFFANLLSAVTAVFTDFSATNATTTNLVATNATTTNGTIDNLFSTNAVLTNATSTFFAAVNASTTNATSTNLVATNATSTNLFASLLNAATGAFTDLTSANATTTNLVATNATSTNLFTTIFSAVTGSFTNLIAGTSTLATTTVNGFLTINGNTSIDNGGTLTVGDKVIAPGEIGAGTSTPSGKISIQNTNPNQVAFLVYGTSSQVAPLIDVFDNPTSNTRIFSISATGTLFAPAATITDLVATNATTTNFFTNLFSAVTGSFTNLSTTNATSTNATSTNLFSTNAVLTNATSTFFAAVNASTTNATSSYAYITNLVAGSSTLSDALLTRSTTTDAYITRLVAASSTLTDAIVTTLNATNATFANATSTNLVATNATSTNLFANVGNFLSSIINTLTAGSITATSSLTSNGTLNVTGQTTLATASSTGLTATNLYSTTGTIANLASTNIVTTNATATNASTTNLTATNFWSTLSSIVTANVTHLVATNATTTNASTTNGTVTNLWSTLANIVTGNFTDLVATNATTTNASTTNGTITNLWSTTGSITNLTNTNATSSNLYAVLLNAGTTTLATTTISTLTVTGQTTLATASSTGLTVSGNTFVTGTTTLATTTLAQTNVAGDILPTTDISRSLGSNVLRFLNLFTQNIFATSSVITNATSTNFFATQVSGTNGYFTGGLGVGVATTTPGALQTSGDAYIGGSLTVAGSLTSSITNGQIQFLATPFGTNINEGTVYINPPSAGTNNVLLGLAVNGTEKARIDAEGDVQIVGTFNSTNTSGTNNLSGNFSVGKNVTLGTNASNTITFNGSIASPIIPDADATYDIGSPTHRFGTLYVTGSNIANLAIDGVSTSTFLINSDNATFDTEDSMLEFSRGSSTPNARIKWNSTLKQFEFNNFPVSFANSVTVAGTGTSTVAGLLNLTGTPAGIGLGQGSLFINPGSGSTDYTLLGIGVNGVERFRVDAEGDTTIQASLGIANSLYNISLDTLTVNDKLQVNGNEIKDSTGNTRIAIGSTNTLTGNVGITGALNASSTLAVTGATTLYGTLNVNGQTTLATASSTGLTVSGNTFVTGTTTLATTTATAITATGQATLATASSTGLTATSLYFTSATGTNVALSGYLNASGTLAVTGQSSFFNTLNVAADILPTTTNTRSLGTNALRFLNTFTQNLFATSSVITNATSTNLFAAVGNFLTSSINTLTGGTITATSSLSSQGTLSVTGTSTLATTTATTLTVSGQTTLATASSTGLTATNLYSTTGTVANLTNTNSTSTGFFAVTGTSTLATTTISSLTTTNETVTNSTITNASTTNLTVSNNAYFAGSGIWNSSGNVGIGTTTSTSKLHVNGGNITLDGGTFNVKPSSGFSTVIDGNLLQARAGSYLTFVNNRFQMANTVNGGVEFATGVSTSTRMVIDNLGNVGIGTTTPGSLLSVQGNGYFGGNLTATGTLNVSGQTTLATASSTGLTVSGNTFVTGTTTLATTTLSQLTASGMILASSGNPGASGYMFSGATNTGLGYNGSYMYTGHAGTGYTYWMPNVFAGISSVVFGWGPNTNIGAALDTGLARNAAGVVEINNGTAGTYRDLIARAITSTGTSTFATTTATTLTVSGQTTLANASTTGLTASNFYSTNASTTNLSVSGESSFMGGVGVGTSSSGIAGKINFLGGAYLDSATVIGGGQNDLTISSPDYLNLIGNFMIQFSSQSKFTASTLFTDNILAKFGQDNDYSIGYSSTRDSLQIMDGATINNNVRLALNRNGNISIGTTTSSARLSIMQSYGSTTPLFDVATTTSAGFATSSLFTVLASGNVGIGTSSPDSLLSVQGNAYIGGNVTATGTLNVSGQTTLGTASSTGLTVTDSAFLATGSGAVGIGTTSLSTYALNIASPTGSTGYIRALRNNTGSIDFLVDAFGVTSVRGSGFGNTSLTVNTGATSTSGIVVKGIAAQAADLQKWVDSANNVLANITAAGYLGIGTSTPGSLLSVQGNGYFGGTITATGTITSQSGSNFITVDSANSKIRLFNSGVEDLSLTAITNGLGVNGIITASSTITSQGSLVSSADASNSGLGAGTVDLWSSSGNPSYVAFSERSVGNRGIFGFGAGSGDLVYRQGATTMANGTEVFRISSAGNVGIGSSTPAAKLGVTGNAYIGGNLTATGTLNVTGNTTLTNASTTNLTVSNNAYLSSFTAGSIPFIGTAGLLSQNNSNFFWDNTNAALGLGTTTFARTLNIQTGAAVGTGGIKIVGGSTSSADLGTIEVIGRRGDANTSGTFTGTLALAHNRSDAAIATSSLLGRVLFGGNNTDGTLANIAYPTAIAGVAEGTFLNNSTSPAGLAFYTGSTATTTSAVNVQVGTERMRISSNGEVGIGVSSPSSLLHVGGTYTTSNGSAIALSPTFVSSNTSQQNLIYSQTSVSPSGASLSALYGILNLPTLANSSANVTSVFGNFARIDANANYTGLITNAYDFSAGTPSNSSGKPYTNFAAYHAQGITNGNGTSTGTVSNFGFYFTGATASSSGTATINNYGFFGTLPSGSPSGGTTNNYGLYINGNGGTSNGGTVNNYGIYNTSTANNYFAGNIGIGTTTPTVKLSVYQSGVSPAIIDPDDLAIFQKSGTVGDDAYISVVGDRYAGIHFGDEATTNDGYVQYYNTDRSLRFGVAGNSDQMLIASNGDVGIGSTTPAGRLGVSGNVYVAGNITETGTLTVSGTASSSIMGALGIGIASPVSNLQIHNSSAATVLKLTNSSSGSGAQDGLSIALLTGTADSQLWNYENGYMRFATNNAERMRIDASGNVGIGTTTPISVFAVASSTASGTSSLFSIGTTSPIVNILANNFVQLGLGSVIGVQGAGSSATFNGIGTLNNTGLRTGMYVSGDDIYFKGNGNGSLTSGDQARFVNQGGLRIASGNYFGWGSGDVTTSNDTALSRISAGKIGIGTGAAGSFTGSLAVGNVAVGTSTGPAKLSVQGDYGGTTTLFDVATTTSSAFATSSLFTVLANGNVGVATSSPVQLLSVGSSGGISATFAGNVGVGRSSPSYPLDVNGYARVTSGLILNGGDPNTALVVNGGAQYASASYALTNYGNSTFGLVNRNVGSATYQALDFSTVDSGGNNAYAGATIKGLFSGLGTGALSGSLSFSTNNNSNATTERMRIDSTGNVGIGTTTPTSLLTVASSTASGTSSLFSVGTSTTILSVLANGNVGIGSSTPSSPLTVTASSTTGSNIIINNTSTSGFAGGTSGGLLTIKSAASSVSNAAFAINYLSNNTTQKFAVDTAGRVYVSTTPGSENAPQYTFLGNTGTGMWSTGSTFLAFSVGSSERMRIDSSGNVGIGTTSPAAKFAVNGDAYIAGNITATGTLSVASFAPSTLTVTGTTSLATTDGVVILGSGEAGTPGAFTLRGAAGVGTDIAGADMTFDASNGTGAGGSGAFIFRTAPATPASNTPNLDAVATTSQTGSGSQVVKSWNHTVTASGSNKILIVTVSYSRQAETTTSAVSYGGQSLTHATGTSQSNRSVSVWYLLNPPTGTNTVTATTTSLGSNNGAVYASMSFTDVNQSTPFGTAVSADVTGGTSVSTSVTPSLNDVILSFVVNDSGGTFTAQNAQTQRYIVASGSAGGGMQANGATLVATTTSPTTSGWTLSGSGNISEISIPLKGSTISSSAADTLTEAMRITNGQYVGIGTTTPATKLQVAGDIRVGTTGTNGCVQGYGGATLTGTCSSDERLKDNVTDINDVLDRFSQLRVINYNWNKTANTLYHNDMNSIQTGYLAQNVEALFPELVTVNKEGYKQVNYSAMSLYTAEAVKELATNNRSVSMFQADEAVDYGTIVAFSTSTHAYTDKTASTTFDMVGVRKAANGDEAIGVVTVKTASTTIAGASASSTFAVPVAFSGKMVVKLSSDSADVQAGEYLTVSTTTPGAATKMTQAGRSIGQALSSGTAGGSVLVLVQLGYENVDTAGRYATTTAMLTTGNLDLNANGVAIINIKSLASASGAWSISEDGRIVAKVLCLDDVCIDKNVLTNILNSTGQSGIVAGTSTTATGTTGNTSGSTSTATTTTDTGSSTPTGTATDTASGGTTSTSSTDTSSSTPTTTTDTSSATTTDTATTTADTTTVTEPSPTTTTDTSSTAPADTTTTTTAPTDTTTTASTDTTASTTP